MPPTDSVDGQRSHARWACQACSHAAPLAHLETDAAGTAVMSRGSCPLAAATACAMSTLLSRSGPPIQLLRLAPKQLRPTANASNNVDDSAAVAVLPG